MPKSASDSTLPVRGGDEPSAAVEDIKGLILVPALITLGVTVARLAGEVLHGPRRLFNSDPGGPWAIVGIVWLAPIFGVYFALKLAARGQGPKSFGRALGLALLGVAVLFTFSFLGSLFHLQAHFRGRLLYLWTAATAAALVALPGWRALFRALLAYAYAARLPVVAVMFFAFWQNWGTHYDAPPPDMPEGFGMLAKFFWLGFFPQLIFWVGVTILAGMLTGSLAAGIAQLPRSKVQT
jgi:cytochrome c oxidase subunit IV